jgi:protein TonB
VPAAPSTPTLAAIAAAAAAPAAAGSQRSATAAVVLPSSDADYLHNPPPTYPRMSRRLGEQGTVVLRVFINTEGRAEQAEVRTSSGFGRLDEAALETVRRWPMCPASAPVWPRRCGSTCPSASCSTEPVFEFHRSFSCPTLSACPTSGPRVTPSPA